MSPLATTSNVFLCVLAGALLGMLLRELLPKHHLSDNSQNIVMLAMGLVATMTADLIRKKCENGPQMAQLRV
jgi:zinc transporter ZupT